MRHYLVIALACSMLATATAQQTGVSLATRVAQSIDSNAYRSHLEFLADDALEGRAPGTRGGSLAAKYIAAQFQRLGLEPAGDSGSYFHRVPIISLTPDPTLRVTRPQSAELKYRDDYVLWAMRNDSLVQL